MLSVGIVYVMHFQSQDSAIELTFGESLRRSFATPNPFVLTNKICLNQ